MGLFMTMIDNAIKSKPLSLSASVEQTIKNHLQNHDGNIVDLYKLVMEEIEEPLYRCVIEQCRYNQSRAAGVLGVSRGTLRSKLKYYFDDQYVGTRD